jgi:DNA repair exonuclease SbcCD ATPase subunit
MTMFNWATFNDKEFVALIRNGGIVAGYDNDFSRAMVEETAQRIEAAEAALAAECAAHETEVALLRAERAEVQQALDDLRQYHSKIVMALYEIDHDVFGPLTSVEGVAELKRQRDEARRQLEQARKALSVISETVAGLERQPAPVIKRSIKEIQGWTRAALS